MRRNVRRLNREVGQITKNAHRTSNAYQGNKINQSLPAVMPVHQLTANPIIHDNIENKGISNLIASQSMPSIGVSATDTKIDSKDTIQAAVGIIPHRQDNNSDTVTVIAAPTTENKIENNLIDNTLTNQPQNDHFKKHFNLDDSKADDSTSSSISEIVLGHQTLELDKKTSIDEAMSNSSFIQANSQVKLENKLIKSKSMSGPPKKRKAKLRKAANLAELKRYYKCAEEAAREVLREQLEAKRTSDGTESTDPVLQQQRDKWIDMLSSSPHLLTESNGSYGDFSRDCSNSDMWALVNSNGAFSSPSGLIALQLANSNPSFR
jgi:hypothetical protein